MIFFAILTSARIASRTTQDALKKLTIYRIIETTVKSESIKIN
jgi:hypothetical protein